MTIRREGFVRTATFWGWPNCHCHIRVSNGCKDDERLKPPLVCSSKLKKRPFLGERWITSKGELDLGLYLHRRKLTNP
jgi:hypothetical protein